jgi:hypothetical protein
MTTSTVNIHAAAEEIANETLGTQPTPEFIDELAKRYLAAKARSADAQATVAAIELEAIALVRDWGFVPAHAEKSRKLNGKLAELTVTKADTLTVVDERVETLRDALFVNGYGAFFAKLFAERKKWEVIEGAEAALKSESLPKRLSEKVLNLWGRCISVKPKKPSLKVVLADPAKPAKRAKKATAK